MQRACVAARTAGPLAGEPLPPVRGASADRAHEGERVHPVPAPAGAGEVSGAAGAALSALPAAGDV